MQIQDVCHKYYAAFKNELLKQNNTMDHENFCPSYKRNFITASPFIAT